MEAAELASDSPPIDVVNGPGDPDLRNALGAVTAALEQIRAQLAAGHERAAAREQIIDRLHEENQRLRAGERQLVLRPLLVDVQKLRDGLLREATLLPADFTPQQAAALLASFAGTAEMALERGGVLVVRPEPGTPFDPAVHRPAGVVPARAADEDGTVHGVSADGYLDMVTGRALSPAAVVVRRWVQPALEGGPQTGEARE